MDIEKTNVNTADKAKVYKLTKSSGMMVQDAIVDIVKTNVNTADKVKVYKLTKSSGMMVQDAPAGLSVPVVDWMIYNDPKMDKDGNVKDNLVLSIVDPSGVKYSTISATFMREFLDIVDIMDGTPFAILFIHGTTKAGTAFVSCELDCDYKA